MGNDVALGSQVVEEAIVSGESKASRSRYRFRYLLCCFELTSCEVEVR